MMSIRKKLISGTDALGELYAQILLIMLMQLPDFVKDVKTIIVAV